MTTDMMIQDQVLQQAADAGRATDTILAHLTLGEVVIPRELMEDPEVAQAVQAIFDAYGENIGEFTVGDPANKINPETGYPEFFLKKLFKGVKKVFKKIAPIALPILGSMIPGVGPVLGAALGGAAGGAISGGGLKGALKGAALSGLSAAAGGALGGAAGGLGKAGTTINWTSAAPGYSTGLQTVGGSGVLGALSRGGALSQGVGNALGSVSSALKGVIGTPAGSTLERTSGIAGMQGPTMGTGALGAATRATGLGLPTTGAGGGLGSLVRTGASLYSALQEDEALEDAQRAQLAALRPYEQMSRQAQEQLSGNIAEGFDPGDLTNDAGYQFRLNQGMDALNSQLAAQGLGQSGAALKAAQEYGQAFAQNEFGNAYDRWLQQNQQLGNLGGQGLTPATGIGNVNSATTLAQADAKNRRIAEILSSLGL